MPEREELPQEGQKYAWLDADKTVRSRGGPRIGRYGDHPSKRKDEFLDDAHSDFEPGTSTPTIEHVEESETLLSKSAVLETLRENGCDELFDPYQMKGKGIFNKVPSWEEREEYWTLLRGSPYPYGVCPKAVRDRFTDAVSVRFDLAPFEVVNLIDMLPRLIPHVKECVQWEDRLTEEDLAEILRCVKSILIPVVREAEANDPHSLENYHRREIYEIAGLNAQGTPNGKWYQLDECIPNDPEKKTFRIRVGCCYWAQIAGIANETKEAVPAKFIRPKPTEALLAQSIAAVSEERGHPMVPGSVLPLKNDAYWTWENEKRSEYGISVLMEAARRIGDSPSSLDTGQVSHGHLKQYVEHYEYLRGNFTQLVAHAMCYAILNPLKEKTLPGEFSEAKANPSAEDCTSNSMVEADAHSEDDSPYSSRRFWKKRSYDGIRPGKKASAIIYFNRTAPESPNYEDSYGGFSGKWNVDSEGNEYEPQDIEDYDEEFRAKLTGWGDREGLPVPADFDGFDVREVLRRELSNGYVPVSMTAMEIKERREGRWNLRTYGMQTTDERHMTSDERRRIKGDQDTVDSNSTEGLEGRHYHQWLMLHHNNRKERKWCLPRILY